MPTSPPSGRSTWGTSSEQVLTKLLEKGSQEHRAIFLAEVPRREEAAEQRAKFYEDMHEGDIIEGEVSSLTDFGASSSTSAPWTAWCI